METKNRLKTTIKALI